MTDTAAQENNFNAVDALVAYLMRVDMQLMRAGMNRTDRDAVCQQIIEQFHDVLPVELDQASAGDVEAALAQLSSDVAFASDDITSMRQVLRMLWHRFWIDTPAPTAFNDGGKRLIRWSELVKRLGLIYFVMVVISLTSALMLIGELWASSFIITAVLAISVTIGFIRHLHKEPLASLPRAEHAKVKGSGRYRMADIFISIGSFLLILFLFPMIYIFIAALSQRPVWPLNQTLFPPALLTFIGLCSLITFLTIWQQRQRHRQFHLWAEGTGTG